MEKSRGVPGRRIKRKQVDFLKIRLQRMVRAMLYEENFKSSCYYFGEYRNMLVKGLWFAVLLTCMGTFAYQTYDRIYFYFSFPITTDIFITEETYQTLPAITICNQETELLFNFYTKFYISVCRTLAVVPLLARINSVEKIWEVLNSTTELFSAKEISNESAANLTYTSIPLVYGTCTTFQSASKRPVSTGEGRFDIIFKLYSNHVCRKRSMTPVFVHDVDDALQSRKVHFHSPGMLTEVGLTVTQVIFLNRTGNICVSNNDYSRCEEECYNKYSLKKGICRFPFHPPRINLKSCSNSSSFLEWENMISLSLGEIDNETCICPRKCQHRIFDVKDTVSEDYENMTRVVLQFDNSHATEIRERYVYDLIKLLSDIGGLSGLYVGVSLLSVFEIVPTVTRIKKKRPKFNLSDPLYCIVLKVFKGFRKSGMPLKRKNPKFSHSREVFNRISLAVCIGLFAFGVVNRVLYYFQHPYRTIVDSSFNTSLETPSLTICPGDNRVIELQRLYAIKHNLSDVCEVKLWKLLELPGINASYIWINPQLVAGDFWFPSKAIYLQDGTCVELDDGKKIVPANRNIWIGSKLPAICGTTYLKVFIRSPTKYYDYFQYRYLIHKRLQDLLFIIKEIRIDEKFQACSPEEENASCKHECLTNKLWQRVNCRLPYMPEGSLPLCSSSDSAKHSYLTYWELFSLPSSSQDCNCLPSCHKRFYETRLSVSRKHGLLHLSFGASHNVVESFRKLPSYSLIALLSDVGGLLGPTLGLCILSIFQILFTRCANSFSGWIHQRTYHSVKR